MILCRPETPQAAADALRPWWGKRFTAAVTGDYGSGKTTALAHIIGGAVAAGLPIHTIAAFGPTHAAAHRLRTMVGSFWPDVPAHDLFGDGMSGTPVTAALERTVINYSKFDPRHSGAVDEFLALIKRAGELGDDPPSRRFLKARRDDIRSAIQMHIAARLEDRAPPLNPFLDEVAEFFTAYKQRTGEIDIADLYLAPVRPTACSLLILDDIASRERAMLRRIFPDASTIMTGPADQPCDLCISLGESLRKPERVDIEDATGPPSLVPCPGGSVMILLPGRARWRVGEWMRWCDSVGLSFRNPHSQEWRAVISAWRIDQGERVPFKWIEGLLAASALDCLDDSGFVDRDDIPGWRGWRRLAITPMLIAAADNILARFGSLRDLSPVRIMQAAASRGIEADTVIVDCFARGFPDVYPLALTRATRRLIVIQGKRATQRIQVLPIEETAQRDTQQVRVAVHDQR